ncbi:hypothetical protein R3P38DRAFT_2864366 [Favolaschia claudopus]|uniref:Uncharacterized protein n=1 Tax=Favolaschia claudopus TaxID=2862362 RepID=A0AAW0DGH0_9AGAR
MCLTRLSSPFPRRVFPSLCNLSTSTTISTVSSALLVQADTSILTMFKPTLSSTFTTTLLVDTASDTHTFLKAAFLSPAVSSTALHHRQNPAPLSSPPPNSVTIYASTISPPHPASRFTPTSSNTTRRVASRLSGHTPALLHSFSCRLGSKRAEICAVTVARSHSSTRAALSQLHLQSSRRLHHIEPTPLLSRKCQLTELETTFPPLVIPATQPTLSPPYHQPSAPRQRPSTSTCPAPARRRRPICKVPHFRKC